MSMTLFLQLAGRQRVKSRDIKSFWIVMQTEGSCFVYICNLVKSTFVTEKREFVTYENKKILPISAINEMFLFYSPICTLQASFP